MGKSVCVVTDVLHLITKRDSGLGAASHQGHLGMLIDAFEFQLGENPDLMSVVDYLFVAGATPLNARGNRSWREPTG